MALKVTGLTTELATTPMGLDVLNPRFGWKIRSDARGTEQSAYSISVTAGDREVWSTGWVESAESIWVEYGGELLRPRTRYSWTVTVRDNHGSEASESSYFETGHMDSSIEAWQGAKWIGAGSAEDGSENVLTASAKPVFNISAAFRLGDGCKKAGLIFGADDPRLLDSTKNDYLIEGKNYIKYVVTHDNRLEIYRVGYHREDSEATPLAAMDIADFDTGEKLALSPGELITLRVEVLGNNAYAYINGVKVDAEKQEMRFPPDANIPVDIPKFRVVPRQLNPTGSNDVVTYPMLCNIGVCAENSAAEFDYLRVEDVRPPSAKIFELSTETIEATRFSGFIGNGLEIADGKIVVKNTAVTADPSHTSVPMLRKEFEARDEIASARLYATSRGIYEFHINGSRLGENWFEPGAGQYDTHLLYQTYDVTDMLSRGKNAIGCILSSGWWNESQTFSLPNYNYWGDRQSLLAMLVVDYKDGTKETIISDESWKYFGEGPITFAGFFYGEHFDARRADILDSFSLAEYNDAAWKSAAIVANMDYSALEKESGFISWPVPSNNQPALMGYSGSPIKHIKTLTALAMTEPRPGVYVYDMGQNMVGVPEVTMRGKKGESATLRYGEILYPALEEYGGLEGMLLVENYRDAISTDRYTFAGGEKETYVPRFTFHGYRYIEISGVAEPPALDEVKGLVLTSIDRLTGGFECSDGMVNKLSENILWSQYANFISIPTDCPQRNERMGWCGDAQVFARTACYNADVYSFYRRWLMWLRDCQLEDGRYPDIAPVGGGFGGIEWGSAGIIVTYEMWRQYGDSRIIEENYAAMCRYMDFLKSKGEPGLLTNVGPLGDWLAADMSTDNPLLWNAVYYHDAKIISAMAKSTGKDSDADKFGKLAEVIKENWNHAFIDPSTGKTRNIKGEINDTQASYSMPLEYGVFADPARAAGHLARKTAEVDYSVTTGFVGTGPLCPALSEGGYSDIAYRVLRQTNYPSWLYSITQGSTTIWERWNSYTVEKGFGGNNAMNSFNHYSLGAVGAWMYGYILGIRRGDGADGFRSFVYKPEICGLDHAEGWFESMYGQIESSWKISGDTINVNVTIPAGAKVEMHLPVGDITEGGKSLIGMAGIAAVKQSEAGTIIYAGSGSYSFVIKP